MVIKRGVRLMAAAVLLIGLLTGCTAKEEGPVKIVSPQGEVFPYVGQAQAYLQSESKIVSQFIDGSFTDPSTGVEIAWEYEGEPTGFTVEVATRKDYADAQVLAVSDPAQRRVTVYNLYKGTGYYVRVTATDLPDAVAESTFTTTDVGPRVMTVDGIYNVRDLGGYTTADGKRLKQGLLYRGGALSPSTDKAYDFVQLTDRGKATMAETMGIKTELDFRNVQESLGVTESPIPGAELVYCGLGGYDDGLRDHGKGYRDTFRLLADADNYPIYMHCTGGADRTGTVSFLLLSLLGVDEQTAIKDYEFTSFSVYGTRDARVGVYGPTYFQPFLKLLNSYRGDTPAEKAASYLLSVGVTQAERDSIREILVED